MTVNVSLANWSVHHLLTDESGALLPTVKVEVAAKVLGIGRTAAYAAADAGEIPTIRLGRRLVVPVPKLLELLGAAPPDPPTPALRAVAS